MLARAKTPLQISSGRNPFLSRAYQHHGPNLMTQGNGFNEKSPAPQHKSMTSLLMKPGIDQRTGIESTDVTDGI